MHYYTVGVCHINPLRLYGYFMYHQVQHSDTPKFRVLSTGCMYVLRVVPEQRRLLPFLLVFTTTTVCLRRATNCILRRVRKIAKRDY